MRGAKYDCNADLMDPCSRSNTSWPRHEHGDHVHAMLDMSEAYLHATTICHEERAANTDRSGSLREE
jgi:hypothetical protein